MIFVIKVLCIVAAFVMLLSTTLGSFESDDDSVELSLQTLLAMPVSLAEKLHTSTLIVGGGWWVFKIVLFVI
jgi:hypothetical protein